MTIRTVRPVCEVPPLPVDVGLPSTFSQFWNRQYPEVLVATRTRNLELLVFGQQLLNYQICEQTGGAFWRDKNGLIMGLAIYENWTQNSVQMHYALPNPMVLRRGFLQRICHFVFNTAGRKLIIGITPSDNARALALNARIGFRETHRIRDGEQDGVDSVIQELRRVDAARWLMSTEHG